MAPRVPILLKEVVYTLSPFEQSVTSGLWRDFSYKVTKQIQEVTMNAGLFCVLPTYAIYSYCSAYREAEKLEHRY